MRGPPGDRRSYRNQALQTDHFPTRELVEPGKWPKVVIQTMRAILEKLRQANSTLPPGATPEQLSNFEKTLGRRLPGALRSLYLDHNGEPGGRCLFRLLPLHDAYPVGDGRWCFWESRYDPRGDGADYEFRDGSVRCQHRTFRNVQAFLEDQLLTTERMQDPSLPEAFLQAERLDCGERAKAIQAALAEARVESASALLGYLRDETRPCWKPPVSG